MHIRQYRATNPISNRSGVETKIQEFLESLALECVPQQHCDKHYRIGDRKSVFRIASTIWAQRIVDLLEAPAAFVIGDVIFGEADSSDSEKVDSIEQDDLEFNDTEELANDDCDDGSSFDVFLVDQQCQTFLVEHNLNLDSATRLGKAFFEAEPANQATGVLIWPSEYEYPAGEIDIQLLDDDTDEPTNGSIDIGDDGFSSSHPDRLL